MAFQSVGFPLAVGVGVYAAWRLTRWSAWIQAGLLTMVVGGVGVVLAGILLTAHVVRQRGEGAPWGEALGGAVAPAALAVLAVVTGLGLASSALDRMSDHVVTVRNQSRGVVRGVEVFGGGASHVWADLEPGESETATLRVRQDGVLEYRATVGGETRGGVIEGYVTPGMPGGRATVVIREDGTVGRGLLGRL